jgi:hypothetical protein
LTGSDPGLAWETAGVLAGLAGGPGGAATARERLVADCPPLQLLLGIQDRGEREAALAPPCDRHGRWTELWSDWMLHEQHRGARDDSPDTRPGRGGDLLDSGLEAVFRNRLEHPHAFVAGLRAWCSPVPGAAAAARDAVAPREAPRPDPFEFGPLRARAKSLLDGGRRGRVILSRLRPSKWTGFVAPGSRGSLGRAAARASSSRRPSSGAGHRRRSAPLFRGEQGGDRGQAAGAGAPGDRDSEDARRASRRSSRGRTCGGTSSTTCSGTAGATVASSQAAAGAQGWSSDAQARRRRHLGSISARWSASPPLGLELPPITILGSWDADVERRIFANGRAGAAAARAASVTR